MADSHAHTLGEQIGIFFENAMKVPILEFATSRSLYFDTFGYRQARLGKKVTWLDVDGNRHDLDYVLERGGTDTTIGEPVAFIELAWRRYTKHSKNKVQEIYGAVNPIAQKFARVHPFKGAILSGDFTITSIDQLQSQGFSVLYIPFQRIVSAFAEHGIDIYFDEHTSEDRLGRIVAQWRNTPETVFAEVRKSLYASCAGEMREFVNSLRVSVDRKVRAVHVVPLYGNDVELTSVADAIDFVCAIADKNEEDKHLHTIEIVVLYDNGTRIEGRFVSRSEAVDFLRGIGA